MKKSATQKKTFKVTKAEMVIIYAILIKIMGNKSASVIFKPLNYLIIRNWSMSALEDIKNAAWKIIESGKTAREIYDEAETASEIANAKKC